MKDLISLKEFTAPNNTEFFVYVNPETGEKFVRQNDVAGSLDYYGGSYMTRHSSFRKAADAPSAPEQFRFTGLMGSGKKGVKFFRVRDVPRFLNLFMKEATKPKTLAAAKLLSFWANTVLPALQSEEQIPMNFAKEPEKKIAPVEEVKPEKVTAAKAEIDFRALINKAKILSRHMPGESNAASVLTAIKFTEEDTGRDLSGLRELIEFV